MFSKQGAHVRYCQSWKDLTTEEMARFFSNKTRAVCHLNKGHVGAHEDKVLEVAWDPGGWPRAKFRSTRDRAKGV